MGFANTCTRGFLHVAVSLAVLLAGCACCLTGCGGADDTTATNTDPAVIVIPAELTAEPAPQRVAELIGIGEAAFKQSGCIACHLASGQALTGPALANIFDQPITLTDGRVIHRDLTYLYRSIVVPNEYKSKTGKIVMPPYAHLDEEKLVGMVYFVRSLSPGWSVTADQEGADSDE